MLSKVITVAQQKGGTGKTTLVVQLALAFIKYHNLNHIHEIWPNLQVYTSGGVAFGPYEKSFNALMGKPVTVIDTYLASEGYIATQVRPETDAMQLNTDNGIYFEFVPFNFERIFSILLVRDNAAEKNCINLIKII